MQTQRELELEAIDNRVAAIQEEKVQIKKSERVALALEKMQQTDEYKLVIEQTYLSDEITEITSFLGGDKHLPDDMVEEMMKSLQTIRGFKAAMSYMLEAKDTAEEAISNCDARIADETRYRAEVFNGSEELGE